MAEIIPSEQKFHTLDKDTPTKDRGSKQAQALRKIYTMDDIASTVAADIGVVTTKQFNNVAAMVSSSSVVGDVVSTLGYHTEGDQGGMVYDIAASGTADAGSEIALTNGTYAIARLTGDINPIMWGAKANDGSASSANVIAMNAMTLWLSTLGNDVAPNAVLFPQGTYYIDDTIFLPIGYPDDGFNFIIDFNGSRLKNNGATDFIMLHRDMDNRTYAPLFNTATDTASNLQFYVSESLAISNLSIFGRSQDPANVGIQIEASFGSSVFDVGFNNHGTALSLQFALQTTVSQCNFGNFLNGVWIGNGKGIPSWNTNGSSNQSNATTVNHSRWYSVPTSYYSVFNDGCSGVVLQSPIFEGHDPDYRVIATGSNWARSMEINDCHIEGGIERECSFSTGSGMSLLIRNLYPQDNGRTLIRGEGFDLHAVYWPGNTKIDLTGSGTSQPWTCPISESGSGTQGATADTLVDPSADFVAAGVSVGDTVLNYGADPDLLAFVLSIDSATQLTLDTSIMPASGATAEAYNVYRVVLRGGTCTFRGNQIPDDILDYCGNGPSYFTDGQMPLRGYQVVDDGTNNFQTSTNGFTQIANGYTIKTIGGTTADNYNSAPSMDMSYYRTRFSKLTAVAGAFVLQSAQDATRNSGTPHMRLVQPNTITTNFNVYLPADGETGTLAMDMFPQGHNYGYVSPVEFNSDGSGGTIVQGSGVSLQDASATLYAFPNLPIDRNKALYCTQLKLYSDAGTPVVGAVTISLRRNLDGLIARTWTGDLDTTTTIDIPTNNSATRIQAQEGYSLQITVAPGSTATIIYGAQLIFS